jgi:hypothetical protein
MQLENQCDPCRPETTFEALHLEFGMLLIFIYETLLQPSADFTECDLI